VPLAQTRYYRAHGRDIRGWFFYPLGERVYRHRIAGLRYLTIHSTLINLRMYAALFPLYCLQLDMSQAQIGLALSATTGTMMATNTLAGHLADRFHLHHFMIRGGTGLAGLACLGMALWPSPLMVFVAMPLLGLAYSFIYGTNDAYASLKLAGSPQTSLEFARYMSRQRAWSWIIQVPGIGVVLLLALAWPAQAPKLAAGVQALTIVAAFVVSFGLPRPPRPHRDELAMTPAVFEGGRRMWPLIIYAATMLCLSNIVMTAVQFLGPELGLGGRGAALVMAAMWLCAAGFACTTIATERWLGPRWTPLGLLMAGIGGLVVIGLAPGHWALLGLVFGALVTGSQASVSATRITQATSCPATWLSVSITGSSLLLMGANVLLGWASDRYDVGGACLILAVILGTMGAVAGWKARHAERGW
jgi:MFS family permease